MKKKFMFLIQCTTSTGRKSAQMWTEESIESFTAALQQVEWEIRALNAGSKNEPKYKLLLAWSEEWFK